MSVWILLSLFSSKSPVRVRRSKYSLLLLLIETNCTGSGGKEILTLKFIAKNRDLTHWGVLTLPPPPPTHTSHTSVFLFLQYTFYSLTSAILIITPFTSSSRYIFGVFSCVCILFYLRAFTFWFDRESIIQEIVSLLLVYADWEKVGVCLRVCMCVCLMT